MPANCAAAGRKCASNCWPRNRTPARNKRLPPQPPKIKKGSETHNNDSILKGEVNMQTTARKPYRGISMEGGLATWYAKITRKDLCEFERLARELAKDLPVNARVLEIAPGPGYLSIALAKLGP